MKNQSLCFLVSAVLVAFNGCTSGIDPNFPTGSGKKFPAYKGRVEYKAAGEKQVVVARLDSGEVYLLRPESPIWDSAAGQTLIFRGSIVSVGSPTKITGKTSPEDLWKTQALLVQGKPESALKISPREMPELAPPTSSAGPMMPGAMGGDR